MISAQVLRQRLDVLRAVAADPPQFNDWNQQIFAPDQVVATVDGQIWPLSMTEVATLSDAGAEIGDFGGLTLPADIRASDRIRDEDGLVYELRSVVDAAGHGHHLELLLRRVVD